MANPEIDNYLLVVNPRVTFEKCLRCGKPLDWVRVTAHGGGDAKAEVTQRYEMAECCGIRIEVDLPLQVCVLCGDPDCPDPVWI